MAWLIVFIFREEVRYSQIPGAEFISGVRFQFIQNDVMKAD